MSEQNARDALWSGIQKQGAIGFDDVHTAGVSGSNPLAPTILRSPYRASFGWQATRAASGVQPQDRCSHTQRWRPWRVIVVIAFARQERALEFERYLESGSGKAFAVRHFR